MTPQQIVKKWLQDQGIPFIRVTSQTVSFADLARAQCVFVSIFGARFTQAQYDALQQLAKEHSFRINW